MYCIYSKYLLINSNVFNFEIFSIISIIGIYAQDTIDNTTQYLNW